MISKTKINELEMLFPNMLLKFYTIRNDTDITDLLNDYVYAYIKQPVSTNMTLYILVFINGNCENSFQVALLKNNVSYIQKNLVYRTKALFNQYLNEYATAYNIL